MLVVYVLVVTSLVAPALCDSQEFINHLNRTKYSKLDTPKANDATETRIGMYINSFSDISAKTMDFRISFYLRLAWKDARLAFKKEDHENKTSLSLGEGLWREVWRPDVFFRNEKHANAHDVTVDNTLMRVNTSGDVWFVRKFTSTLSCPMSLQKYPFDTQVCPIMFESFGLTMNSLYLTWLPNPVDLDPNVQLPQFTLTDHVLYDCSQNYTAGAFTCLKVMFKLRRDVGFCVMQVFLPTLLVVCASWLSFWFDPAAVTVRGLVGLLTLLSLITQGAATTDILPQVSYLKAIDVWFVVCLLFVLASLIELAAISVLARRRGAEGDKAGAGGGPAGGRVDWVCRIAFPAAFLVFCILYFSIYSA